MKEVEDIPLRLSSLPYLYFFLELLITGWGWKTPSLLTHCSEKIVKNISNSD